MTADDKYPDDDSGYLPWYRGVPRYAWIVLALAALGWLFDTMDQNIFTLFRQPAVSSLLYPGVSVLTKLQQDAVSHQSGLMSSIFLIGWDLTNSRGGKRGQIRPMIRFCVLVVFSGTGDSRICRFLAFNIHFPERLFWIVSGLPT